jgi:hypothetical protein
VTLRRLWCVFNSDEGKQEIRVKLLCQYFSQSGTSKSKNLKDNIRTDFSNGGVMWMELSEVLVVNIKFN